MNHSVIPTIIEPTECDTNGVPLDWKKCRTCNGNRRHPGWCGDLDCESCNWDLDPNCPTCGGHGSLQEATLSWLASMQWAKKKGAEQTGLPTSAVVAAVQSHPPVPGTPEHAASMLVARCDDCNHPMSNGTWEGDLTQAPMTLLGTYKRGERVVNNTAHLTFEEPREATPDDWHPRHLEAGFSWLRTGQEPPDHATVATHWSTCDRHCQHDRGEPDWEAWQKGVELCKAYAAGTLRHVDKQGKPFPEDWTFAQGMNGEVQASWRDVQVRTGVLAPAGHPHPMIFTRPWDLRPENLSLLCLRCWVKRSMAHMEES